MQTDTGYGCVGKTQFLCQQSGDDAGQDVAHPAAGHAGVACRADHGQVFAILNECAGAFQDHHATITGLQGAGRAKAVALYVSGGNAKQPSRLAGVRREHPGVVLPRRLGQQVEGIRIDDQGQAAARGCLPHRPPPVAAPEPGADGDERGAIQQGSECLASFHAMTHQFRAGQIQLGGMRGPGRHADQSGADPRRRFRRQPCRAIEAFLAANHQHMSVEAFVPGAGAPGQHGPPGGALQAGGRLDAPPGGRVNAKVVKNDAPRLFESLAGKQSALETDETDGQVGLDAGPHPGAGIGVQAGGNIQCHHSPLIACLGQTARVIAVDGVNDDGVMAGDFPVETGAQQGVDQNFRGLEILGNEIQCGAAGLCKTFMGQPGVTLEGGGRRHGIHPHIPAKFVGPPGDDVAITTVIAAAADGGEGAGGGPAFAEGGKGAGPGAFHQFDTGDAEPVDGVLIDGAHFSGAVEVGGQGAVVHERMGMDGRERQCRRCLLWLKIAESFSWKPVLIASPMSPTPIDAAALKQSIRDWGRALGFQQVGVCGIDLAEAEQHLRAWLKAGFHGEMNYMARHGVRRSRPAELVPGTLSVISARMDYLPEGRAAIESRLDAPGSAFISRYALGRDYHKLLRSRLQALARRIEAAIGPFGYRVFTDSAPVMEKPLAEKAGLGWIGKHTNLINRHAGSFFFLGEIYSDLPLEFDVPLQNHCGSCTACIDICPTQAIVGPYRLDARRCIAYLTIELQGSIPEELRAAIGNRIYGCDDCQLVCPWNRYAQLTREADFLPRHHLDTAGLIELFLWDEATFLAKTEGSAIRRIGHESWLRNIAVALGNQAPAPGVVEALRARIVHPSECVREHVLWALQRQLGIGP